MGDKMTLSHGGMISKERRSLILLVMDDCLEVLPLLFFIQHFSHCDQMLKWLIQNKLIGKELDAWFKVLQSGSPLTAIATITRHLNSMHKLKSSDLT